MQNEKSQQKSLQNEKKSVDKFAKSNYIIIMVCDMKTMKKKGGRNMFRNLEAEQARNSYTNQQMAENLNISRVSYENKKKTGKFTALEAKRLCKIFHVKFDYLFQTEPKEEV